MAEEEKGHKMPVHGQICWTDIATSDLEGAQGFYSEIFGWKIRSSGNPEFDYRFYDPGIGEDCGGMYQMIPEMYGGETPPPHFVSYIAVDDIDATCE